MNAKKTRVLYNGITLPEPWPPCDIPSDTDQMISIPYLHPISEAGTRPAVIPVDVGRQLFVDDFLVEKSDLTRVFHHPTLDPRGELAEGWLIDVRYDKEEALYKMWFKTGNVRYCESKNGLDWSPSILALDCQRKGISQGSVIRNPSPAADGNDKYYLLVRHSNSAYGETHRADGTQLDSFAFDLNGIESVLFSSPDGRSFTEVCKTGPGGDTTSLFYNPFRKKYVYSIKTDDTGVGRARRYFECDDLRSESAYEAQNPVFWLRSDSLDLPKEDIGLTPECYYVSAAAYESIMLAAFKMWYGPRNNVCITTGHPKITEIQLGYSRDGFYFDRPERHPFLAASRIAGSWNYGYIHPSSSVYLPVGEELFFYYTCFSDLGNAHGHRSVALARLRRDGFASMEGTGELLTRPIRFDMQCQYLFVNASAEELTCEITDINGCIIQGFSFQDSEVFTGDAICQRLRFGNSDLGTLAHRVIRLRFHIKKGALFAFWFSSSENGESMGPINDGPTT